MVSLLGDIYVDELTAFTVECFKSLRAKMKAVKGGKETEQPVSPSTINRDLAMMKHFVGLIAKWGWLDRSRVVEIREDKLL